MITRLMTEHPASVGESYAEHFVQASGFASHLFVAALVCSVHALLPFLFVKTGSRKIEMLYKRMVTHRDYLLKVVVADIAAYDAFYKRLIERVPLSDVSSSFAMEEIKSTTALPLPAPD